MTTLRQGYAVLREWTKHWPFWMLIAYFGLSLTIVSLYRIREQSNREGRRLISLLFLENCDASNLTRHLIAEDRVAMRNVLIRARSLRIQNTTDPTVREVYRQYYTRQLSLIGAEPKQRNCIKELKERN